MNEPVASGLAGLLEEGGFVMPPLILLSLILFTTLFRLAFELLHLSRKVHPGVDREPLQGAETESLVRARTEWRLHFDRRLTFVQILATSAPLLGLLGTVGGMLKTFSALGLRDGFESLDFVAGGISEALITTETGLSIAIVGLVLLVVLKGCRRRLLSRFESYEADCTLALIQTPPSC